MGKLLVVGSVALDTVNTPFGEGAEILGGSATYFSTSASFFTSVALIAVVGEDFPAAENKTEANAENGANEKTGKGFVESDAQMGEDRSIGKYLVDIAENLGWARYPKRIDYPPGAQFPASQQENAENYPIKKKSAAADHLARNSLVTNSE